MADGNGPGRVTIAGAAFAVLMMVLIIISVWLFIARPWWFPELASVSGAGQVANTLRDGPAVLVAQRQRLEDEDQEVERPLGKLEACIRAGVRAAGSRRSR